MYADDVTLMSASVMERQLIIDSCGEVWRDIGISFNSAKSRYMVIGPNIIRTHSFGFCLLGPEH